MLKDLARRALPATIYSLGRRGVRRWRQKPSLSPLSEAGFVDLLAAEKGAALRAGEVVMVHSSIDRLALGFSFARVLPALRAAVGADGTLLFPATQLKERPETWLQRREVFDVRRSPTAMGLLPELARRQRDAVRSLHPTHSVVGLGPQAAALVEEHHLDVYPCGAQSPYYKLAACGGSIVGLGVDADVLTAIHCVEDLWLERFPVETRRAEVYVAQVRDAENGQFEVRTKVAHPRIRWRQMVRYMRRHISADACRRFTWQGRPCYRADAAALYAQMERLAERGITMYRRGVYRGHILEPLLSHLAEKAEKR